MPVSLFVLIVLGAVTGFTLLTGIGLVDAAFWLLDPTSIELYFESHGGPETATKAFALVVFSGLILTGLWIGETVLNAVFGGQFGEELRRMQTQKAIDSLSDHTIICGHGMFGRTVAQQLQSRGDDVVVIETDESKIARIGDEILAVEGDARREEALRRAGVTRARAVIAGIDDSNVNIQIGVVTSQLAPEARLVVRVGDEMYESVARRAGADTVIIPEVVSGSDVVAGL
nr:NAD(P)-binding protein [Halorientalis brevis]